MCTGSCREQELALRGVGVETRLPRHPGPAKQHAGARELFQNPLGKVGNRPPQDEQQSRVPKRGEVGTPQLLGTSWSFTKDSPRHLPLFLVTWGGENVGVSLGLGGSSTPRRGRGHLKAQGGHRTKGGIGAGILAGLFPACQAPSLGGEHVGRVEDPGGEPSCGRSRPWGWRGRSSGGQERGPPR